MVTLVDFVLKINKYKLIYVIIEEMITFVDMELGIVKIVCGFAIANLYGKRDGNNATIFELLL